MPAAKQRHRPGAEQEYSYERKLRALFPGLCRCLWPGCPVRVPDLEREKRRHRAMHDANSIQGYSEAWFGPAKAGS